MKHSCSCGLTSSWWACWPPCPRASLAGTSTRPVLPVLAGLAAGAASWSPLATTAWPDAVPTAIAALCFGLQAGVVSALVAAVGSAMLLPEATFQAAGLLASGCLLGLAWRWGQDRLSSRMAWLALPGSGIDALARCSRVERAAPLGRARRHTAPGGGAKLVLGRAQAVNALGRHQTDLNAMLDASGGGRWEWFVQEQRLVCHGPVYGMLGIDTGGEGCPVQRWIALRHPDDTERLAAHLQRMVDGLEATFSAEYRMRDTGGAGAGSFPADRCASATPMARCFAWGHPPGRDRPAAGAGRRPDLRGATLRRVPDAAGPGLHHPPGRRPLHRREPGFLGAVRRFPQRRRRPHLPGARPLAIGRGAGGDAGRPAPRGPRAADAHPGAGSGHESRVGPVVGQPRQHRGRKLPRFGVPGSVRGTACPRPVGGRPRHAGSGRPHGGPGCLEAPARTGAGVLVGRVLRHPRPSPAEGCLPSRPNTCATLSPHPSRLPGGPLPAGPAEVRGMVLRNADPEGGRRTRGLGAHPCRTPARRRGRHRPAGRDAGHRRVEARGRAVEPVRRPLHAHLRVDALSGAHVAALRWRLPHGQRGMGTPDGHSARPGAGPHGRGTGPFSRRRGAGNCSTR